MTDSPKLDLLLEKMTSFEGRMISVEGELSKRKEQVTNSTAELKVMDKMILDEVERVNRIVLFHPVRKS